RERCDEFVPAREPWSKRFGFSRSVAPMRRNGLERFSEGMLAVAALIVDAGSAQLTAAGELELLAHALAGILLGFGYLKVKPCRRRPTHGERSSAPETE